MRAFAVCHVILSELFEQHSLFRRHSKDDEDDHRNEERWAGYIVRQSQRQEFVATNIIPCQRSTLRNLVLSVTLRRSQHLKLQL